MALVTGLVDPKLGVILHASQNDTCIWFKLAPRWPQDGPKLVPGWPKLTLVGSKLGVILHASQNDTCICFKLAPS